MTLWMAILLALWVWVYRSGIFYSAFGFVRQPLVAGLVVGLVLGDVPNAMIASVPIQLIYMGLNAAGGAIPTDTCIGTIVGVSTALLTSATPEEAIVIAIPVAIVANQLSTVLYITHGAWVHRAEKAAETLNFSELRRCATLYPLLASFIIYVPIMAFTFYQGPEAAQMLLDIIPERILHGLGVVGKVLPALGFALIIKTIGHKKLLPFFVGAFFLTVAMKEFGGINMGIYTVLGLVMSYLYVIFTSNESAVEEE